MLKSKTIKSLDIINKIADICQKINCNLDTHTFQTLEKSIEIEQSPLGKIILGEIVENAKLAKLKQTPICQDTGMVVALVEIGDQVKIEGGTLYDSINQGVAKGYKDNFLRKSIVKDPLFGRENTKDNTPAVIYVDLVEGDTLKINIAAKGFGSENMSAFKMLSPYEGIQGVKKFVIDTIFYAGSNPCPPIVVGIGIGGTMDKAGYLAKKSLFRHIGSTNPNSNYANLENELLEEINQTGIGPQGLGGVVTALDVFIEHFPTHIAGLPVAVNINCHAIRHEEITF